MTLPETVTTSFVRDLLTLLPQSALKEDIRRIFKAWSASKGLSGDFRLPELINMLWSDAVFSDVFVSSFGSFLKRDLSKFASEEFSWLTLLVSTGMRVCGRSIRPWLISIITRCLHQYDNLKKVKHSLDFIKEAIRVLGKGQGRVTPTDTDEVYALMLKVGMADSFSSLLEWAQFIQPASGSSNAVVDLEDKPHEPKQDSNKRASMNDLFYRPSVEPPQKKIPDMFAKITDSQKPTPKPQQQFTGTSSSSSNPDRPADQRPTDFRPKEPRPTQTQVKPTKAPEPYRPPKPVEMPKPTPMFESSKRERTKIVANSETLGNAPPGLSLGLQKPKALGPKPITDPMDEIHKFALSMDWDKTSAAHERAGSNTSNFPTDQLKKATRFASSEEYFDFFEPQLKAEMKAGIGQAVEAQQFARCSVKISAVAKKGKDWVLLSLKNATNNNSSRFIVLPGDLVFLVPRNESNEDGADSAPDDLGPIDLQKQINEDHLIDLDSDSDLMEIDSADDSHGDVEMTTQQKAQQPEAPNTSSSRKVADQTDTGPSFLGRSVSPCLLGVCYKVRETAKKERCVGMKCLSSGNKYGFDPLIFACDTQWDAVVIYSLNTVEREFSALHWLAHSQSNLVKKILQPRPNNSTLQRHPSSPSSQSSLLNESQAKAVQNACNPQVEDVVLVQGPPGTGKTKAIVSIIQTLLSQRRKFPILVAAPSNAAVDEIALRLLNDGKTGSTANPISLEKKGSLSKPRINDVKVIRLGKAAKISEGLMPFMLEEVVRSKLSATENKKFEHYRTKKGEVLALIAALSDQLKAGTITHTQYTQQKGYLFDSIDKLKASNEETITTTKDSIYAKVLTSCDVLVGTLSSFGAEIVSRNLPKHADVCIVDEAAQAIEVSTLIPLVYGVKKLILVGDPQQLPATLIAKQEAYEQSLFERLMKMGVPVSLLNQQYRMHACISKFPSSYFYQGKLLDAPSILTRPVSPLSNIFGSALAWLDLPASGESRHGYSLSNASEAWLVKRIVTSFAKQASTQSYCAGKSIGVITFYKQQSNLIKRLLGDTNSNVVEVDTVDAFQGREKDIIILSCVRSSESKSIGFVADVRRLNVALTRAKHALWIIGDRKCLRAGAYVWSGLVSHCESNNLCFDATSLSEGDIDQKFQIAKKRPREDDAF